MLMGPYDDLRAYGKHRVPSVFHAAPSRANGWLGGLWHLSLIHCRTPDKIAFGPYDSLIIGRISPITNETLD
jgi:hypothetical protein